MESEGTWENYRLSNRANLGEFGDFDDRRTDNPVRREVLVTDRVAHPTPLTPAFVVRLREL